MSGRIEQIIALLKARGPMTSRQIADEFGISDKRIDNHLRTFRQEKKGIRITGYVQIGQTKPHRLYGIGDAPDAPSPSPRRAPSAVKRLRRPANMTHEEYVERKRLQHLAAQIQPFRDPMIFMTAGRQAV